MIELGKLYLLPNTLTEGGYASWLAPIVTEITNNLTVFVVESDKSARRFIRGCTPKRPLEDIELHLLNEHTHIADVRALLKPMLEGKNVGLLSDAGLPAVADPGSQLVALAHKKGIKVVPLPGPNSIMQALQASGFNGQKFVFHGYLPIDNSARSQQLQYIQKGAKNGVSQIFIETPYRNVALISAICKNVDPMLGLCIAANLNDENEIIISKTVASWAKVEVDQFHKIPAVFVLGY